MGLADCLSAILHKRLRFRTSELLQSNTIKLQHLYMPMRPYPWAVLGLTSFKIRQKSAAVLRIFLPAANFLSWSSAAI